MRTRALSEREARWSAAESSVRERGDETTEIERERERFITESEKMSRHLRVEFLRTGRHFS